MGRAGFSQTPKKLPKYKVKTEILDMLDKAKKDSYRNYIIMLTIWRTGMRSDELVNLKKQDIQDNTITVRQGKGKKDRVVPLESELGNILGLYMDRLKPRDKLFPLTTRQIRNIFYKYSHWHMEGDKKRYEIHPHTFRHSFAVHCLKNGMNLRSLQKILGHSSLNTTQVYLDVVGEDVIEDFDKVVW